MVVENLETAVGRYLADGGRMKGVGVVALATLDKDCIVAQALGKHLAPDVKQVDALPNMSSDVLDRRVPVHVGEEPETEPVRGRGGICESVDDDVCPGGLESLTDSLIQLVVGYGAPIRRLLVIDGHHAGG